MNRMGKTIVDTDEERFDFENQSVKEYLTLKERIYKKLDAYDQLIKEYLGLKEALEIMDRKVNELEREEVVQEYLSLRETREKITERVNRIKALSTEFTGSREYDNQLYPGPANLEEPAGGLTSTQENSKISYDTSDHLQNHKLVDDSIEFECSLELAHAIYTRLKEEYPGRPDEAIARYFTSALYMIQKYPVSEKRKAGRAKRLGLSEDFNEWKISIR